MLKFFGRRKKKEDEQERLQLENIEQTEQNNDSEDSVSYFVAEETTWADDISREASQLETQKATCQEEKTEGAEKIVFETESNETEKQYEEEIKELEGLEEEILEEPETEKTEESDETDRRIHKGFFSRLKEGLSKTRSAIADKVDMVLTSFKTVDEELFEELEEALIMADIGVETSLYIIGELRQRAKEQGIKEALELKNVLKEIISEILINQESKIDTSKKPTVIMVIGVNGVGKTTSIGKMAARYQQEGKKVILAAADTFRAAAIDQLQIWAERAGVEIVKHQEGSDPSAVVFDAIAAAKARNADIVICDTAGRLHNKKNLMEELKKTARVIERETGSADNEVLLVLDGSTGQNALIQAKEFASVARITGVILTKLDGTAKGGVVIALSREQNIGVKFIGVGEGICGGIIP